MEDINDALKAHRIYGPVGIAVESLDKLKDASSLTLSGLGDRVLAAKLGDTQRVAHFVHDFRRKVEKV